ncbi:MAG: PrsW family intramembrane metalloprotease, partial [Anaerolineales bacterium]|nr:PrsW family intramembrane metalloprotease [Anaerolineales bacterium]
MQNKTHLPSTLTFITLCLSILFLVAIVAVLSIGSMINLIDATSDAAGQMIMAFAFGFVCLLLMMCAWFVLEKVRNKETADSAFVFPFSNWQIIVAFGIVMLSIGIGTTASFVEIPLLSWFLLPALTIFVIVPPIWLIFGLGSHGLELGARWRFFSIFGIGMTLAPLIMIVLEIVILFFGIVIGAIYLGITQPETMRELTALADRLAEVTDEQVMLNLLTPYISNPILIAIGIGYIAVIVPLIEELFKPLGVWLFAKQIETPAQGFALGLLSGAAFALFESLNASADGSISWGAIVTARAGTSLLHMTASGIMGWGIVSAFKEKKYG